MAITITEILTIDEYIEVFPQDSAVEEDIIQGAINNATITLDTICGGMITSVWNITDEDDPLFRTTAEHNYIKQATAKQTQYLVSKNLDMSAGSESYTSGSNSYNETRPRPELVVDETIYQLLAQARVYNPNITTNTTIANSNEEDFYNPSYDPSQQYITLQLGDNRYIKKNSDYTEKFLYSNTDGNIEYVDIKLSPTGTSSATANFMTINGVEWALGGGSAASPYWGNIQGEIKDQTDLYTILTQLEDYCNNLDATKAAQSDLEALQQQVANKLDKTTNPAKVYCTNGAGEQTTLSYGTSASASTIPVRTATGSINVGTPTEDNNATTKIYVDELVGTSQGVYLGTAQGTGTDVASDEAASKFIGDYLGVSTTITKNSYFHITIATNDETNEDIYRYIATGNKIDIGGTEYYEYRFGFKFTGDVSLLKQQVATNTQNITTNTNDIATINNTTIPAINTAITTETTARTTADTTLQTNIDNEISRATNAETTLQNNINTKSIVSVSDTGTATDEVSYITIDGTEKKIKTGGGASIISKTYSELKALRDAGTLTAGQWYRITDYVATTTQTNTQATTNQYDIIVLATSINTLSEEARAIQHSGDTYFANSNLNAWKVWYCLDNDTNRFGWASSSGKGVVYHLIDEFNNSVWYDFKLIQVKNNKGSSDRFYYLFDNSGADSSLSSSTSFPSVYGNKLGFYVVSNKFQIGCNVFKGTNFTNNTIGNNFSANTIGNTFYNNTIGNDFYYNTIGESFYSNTIGYWFRGNTIGNYFYSNTIGNEFYSNTIGNEFYRNTIGNGFHSNTIGTSTTDIYYRYNNFGDGIQYVVITDYGTSSAYKSGISLPNGYAGTSSSRKSISSLRNNTTYYIGSDSTLKTLD